MREKIESVDIVGVGVGITADKVRGFWIFGLHLFIMIFQISKGGKELVFFSRCGEVDGCVEGENSFRKLQ